MTKDEPEAVASVALKKLAALCTSNLARAVIFNGL